MQAIIPNLPTRSLPYAWKSISMTPDPPRVGERICIDFPLHNPGPDTVTVERISSQVALFGIGLDWEALPEIGPFVLPPDPHGVVHAQTFWTPTIGGHRCVRAHMHVARQSGVFTVGRNVQVIDAVEGEDAWNVPFKLGNRSARRRAYVFTIGGNDLASVGAQLWIHGRGITLDDPVWLHGYERVDAVLRLSAHTSSRLQHTRTVEAWTEGQLVDGIAVMVRRPAASRLAEVPAVHLSPAVAEPVATIAG